MSTDDPRQIRQEIERTQRTLGADVDALTEKVTPRKIMQRKTDRARRGMTNLREKVMGSASDTASTAGDQVNRAATAVSDAVSDAPQAVRRGTEGNPLAAGLIAFGVGWLTASLLPASKVEQQVADQTKDFVREHSEQLGHVAEQVKDRLSEPVQEAAQSVKSTAQDAVSTVSDEARSSAGNVADRAQEARTTVQEHRS
ncbi:DUF3618 domain-containing protein [Kibdelosporangium phytohabitans]|uniref:DUF3618 domain-containing protein n=1 Tax=Kibdelosporangium phytohabitans TaxID=860235 RepID=A0A0N7F463_9PSEU|nr:DUF3618 domain-containing protein [Kibdelosporangium phytohabitans]ALG10551.1 hypothetical protein AOZ06_29915 [Kibdelosporangium phytohabitans]MBE1461650.1 ElaB/YqjD/DUF883 family membrane-anchored ribosome-binding protein [Kibdelosporangium phytohabitans]